MDNLSYIMQRFSITAGVFYTGHLCGLSQFDDPNNSAGHLHLLRSGELTLVNSERESVQLTEPTLIFIPRPSAHSLRADSQVGAEMVCATVHYGTGPNNPMAMALPSVMAIPLSACPVLFAVVESLFAEAFSEKAGKQFIMDRLSEVLLALLLRTLIERNTVHGGMLAGLSHPRLAAVLNTIHSEPVATHSMEALAQEAMMSRTVFIETFKTVVGVTPGDYILDWRIGLAQGMMRKGKPLTWVAEAVGYSNSSGFARAFRRSSGQSPRQWLAAQQNMSQ